MDIQITLKNYRCFDQEHPARFTLHDGFTSFIGVNNSGKSNILKFFYEFRYLFDKINHPNPHLIDALLRKTSNMSYPPEVYDRSQLFNNTTEGDMTIEIEWSVYTYQNRQDGLPYCSKAKITYFRANQEWSIDIWSGAHFYNTHTIEGANWRDTVLELNGKNIVDCQPLFDVFDFLRRILYIGPFRNAINIGTKQDYFDIQIGQSFIQTWQGYQTGNNAKQNESIFRLIDDIKRIFEYNNLQIQASQDGQTLQFFVNGKSYKLSELGSGIAQFVLVLANASIKQPSFILIDEPELNLHPSLQIDFLTTLSSYAQFGTLFATHSIGLARATSEHIYTVRRNSHDLREVSLLEEIPSLSEFLGELSFAGYRDLGYDQILLVEGSTEVKTFHQFLRKYKKDHKIIVLPLGGSDLIKQDSGTELEEILRISKNVHAIIDSEKDTEESELSKDREAFKVLCEKIGISCKVLDKRATENYFSDPAIKKLKGEKYSALSPFESLKKRSTLGWSKSENWRIAREMTLEELNKTDLGAFLAQL